MSEHARPAPSLWQLINARQPVDARAMRVACAALLVAYAIIATVRFDASHPEFGWIRLAVCLYAAFGLWLSRRIDFDRVRAYAVGAAILLPLAASYVDGMQGNALPEVALTALATFAPLVFLQTGRDLILVNVVLAAGNGAILWVVPTPAVTLATFLVVLGGATAAGTVASLNTLIYRARWSHSVVQLERALAAKSEFLNTMSHELRSPLHMILGYTDLWRDQCEGLEPEFVCARVRTGALELLRMVEDTMNVSRLEAGRLPLRVEQFSLEALAGEVADGLRALPEAQHGVGVEWAVERDLPPVRLDRLKVKEIVQNLASNALKFTREGAVRVVLAREGQLLRIDVRDTGIGIPDEARGRIFQLFERIEPVDGRQPPGIGLGLYIVKSLVQLMRGTIEVAAEPGGGSRFSVRLPLVLDEAAVLPAPARPAARPARLDRLPVLVAA